jgi:hypothetical protein
MKHCSSDIQELLQVLILEPSPTRKKPMLGNVVLNSKRLNKHARQSGNGRNEHQHKSRCNACFTNHNYA